MNILLRTDAGGNIGLGHYFRTMHLAEVLLKQQHNISVAYRNNEFWENEPSISGLEKIVVDGNEEACIMAVCKRKNIDILYVDLILDFDKIVFNAIKENVKIVFYQNLSESRFLADVFILPSIHQKKDFFDIFDKSTAIYQGLEYAIFNKQILNIEEKTRNDLRSVRTASIITGGSDPENLLLRIYHLINHTKFKNINFNYYIGASYLHEERLPEKRSLPINVDFLPYNFDAIAASELVIAAFGVSVYELMSLGMPVLSVGHKPSTASALQFLAETSNALINLGLISDLRASELNEALSDLINNRMHRMELFEKAKNIVDRNGAHRVATIINGIKPIKR